MLDDQQLQIENDMAVEASHRLSADNTKSSKRQAWSESHLGSSYVSSATSRFTRVVTDKLSDYDPSKSGSNVRALKLLHETGLEGGVIAYLFLKTLYNLIPLTHRKRLKRVTFCKRSGDTIHDELRIRFFAQEENRRNLLKKLFKQFDKKTYPRHWRKRTIKNYFHAEQLSWTTWTDADKINVGYYLMILFRDTTGMIDAQSNSIYVDPSVSLMQHIEKTIQARQLDLMLYKPMVVKPIPWTPDNLFRGGYLSDKVKKYPLVKGSARKDAPRILNADWSNILPAINALQETPWRVNHRMLDVLKWCMYEHGGDSAGLPAANPRPLPVEPPGYREDEEATKAHNKVCFLIHSENRQMISKRLLVLSTITVAQQFKNYRQIYFPHNLDSRGRAYPLPVFLQPQGPDYCKSLLEFAEGKSIDTAEDACWLAIACANAYGNDKVSLQERVDWVQENQDDLIFSIARDPKQDVRWMDAAEPFQFLRACMEWTKFWEEGFGFKSHMVVAVDATCSGLQHYSAMLRDEVGGRSVNLVPGLDRQDIYQDVADRTIELLVECNDQSETQMVAANIVRFGITRKETKRQVMVVPYAGTFASCLEYTREAISERVKAGYPTTWDTMDNKVHTQHCVTLSKAIWQAIQEIVLKGREAMVWLSACAREHTRVVNKQKGTAYDKRMSWVTPDGFEVVHFRPDNKKRQLDTYLDGRVVLTYYADQVTLSSADMSLAVAPNFVHSLDANLLRASIVKGLDRGITEYAMVHDSFGVHASEMATFLNMCVKPAFIDMYQKDVLQEFADRLPAGCEIPDKPTQGNLALQDVQDSQFFFS